MVSEPHTATRDARLLFVAKHLERIGDYVTDILRTDRLHG